MFLFLIFYQGRRLNYHGRNEIFEGFNIEEENLKKIVAKVEVLKLEEYAKISREEKFANGLYVSR